MKLPWMSRVEHADILARADADAASATASLRVQFAEVRGELRTVVQHSDILIAEERRRYNDLLARYHMLKLQGFTEPAPERVIARPAVDPIMQAINTASAGKDHRVRGAMIRQAEIDRGADMPEADIIARIQRGNRPMEEVEV